MFVLHSRNCGRDAFEAKMENGIVALCDEHVNKLNE